MLPSPLLEMAVMSMLWVMGNYIMGGGGTFELKGEYKEDVMKKKFYSI